MPGRKNPIITGQAYHVFNRGLDKRVTFGNKWEYGRALKTLGYYQHKNLPFRLSYFLNKAQDEKNILLQEIKANEKIVELLAYCLMPNHFHFLVRQVEDNGISRFMSNFQNSYTRYYNLRNKRVGSLFLDQFKAVRIETDEQLLHVSRYIHLNPYSSYLIEKIKGIIDYPWSSMKEYVYDSEDSICFTDFILANFKNRVYYKKFVLDNADYQRSLELIKHMRFE